MLQRGFDFNETGIGKRNYLNTCGGIIMSKNNVWVYISEDNKDCERVLNLLDKKNVPYEVKNVTKHPENKKEMQKHGIYGTPATFIGDENNLILGYQEEKLNLMLGVLDKNYLLNTDADPDA